MAVLGGDGEAENIGILLDPFGVHRFGKRQPAVLYAPADAQLCRCGFILFGKADYFGHAEDLSCAEGTVRFKEDTMLLAESDKLGLSFSGAEPYLVDLGRYLRCFKQLGYMVLSEITDADSSDLSCIIKLLKGFPGLSVGALPM